jgi:serine/threonine protein kinase
MMAYCCINKHLNKSGVIRCVECNSLVAGVLIGDYRVVSYIGNGSSSDVYLAEQNSLNKRKVVIKMLHRSCNERHIDNFNREAALLASLSHPYILPIFSYGAIYERPTALSNCLPYFVIQFAEQGSLAQVFEQGGRRPWPLERVVTLAEEVAEALDYAHSRNILHRDVKPANLLQIGSHVVLSDFSVASLIDADSSHLSIGLAGSPAFMAPEVWGMHPGRYSDQYALAVTCFFLLAGDYPLTRNGVSNARSWQQLHRFAQPSSIGEYRADVPLAVNGVLQKALAKQPHERYATVHDFASDLLAASQDTTQIPAKSHRPGPAEDVRIRPALNNVQTERKERRETPQVGVSLANTPPANLVALPTTPVPVVRQTWTPAPMQKIPSQEVHTDIPQISRYNNRWIWRSLLLNLLICLVLAGEYAWQAGSVTSGIAILLALCPVLLVGPLLARPFRRVSLTTFSWSLFWGIFFGVTNALLCALVCLAWNILLFVEPFWQGTITGLSDFHRKALALDPQVVVLMLLALWLSVIGGVLIGIFSGLDEDVEPLTPQGSRM